MTAQEFQAWMAAMRATYNVKYRLQDFADMLGVSLRTVKTVKDEGTRQYGKLFLLATTALLHNMEKE